MYESIIRLSSWLSGHNNKTPHELLRDLSGMLPADDAQVQQLKWPEFKERKRRGCGPICCPDLRGEERVGNPLTERRRRRTMEGGRQEKERENEWHSIKRLGRQADRRTWEEDISRCALTNCGHTEL